MTDEDFKKEVEISDLDNPMWGNEEIPDDPRESLADKRIPSIVTNS